MAEECPNCGKRTNTTHTRLVKDSCGHSKCRLCLLNEEHGCKSCENEKQFQQIGNFDYPTRESEKSKNSESLNSKSSISNIKAKPIKLVVNKLTNKFEFFSCGISSENPKESNLTANAATISYTTGENNEGEDWNLKIIEDKNKSSSNNVSIETQNSEKDENPNEVDGEKQKTPITKRKTVDRSHISILPDSPEKYKCNACGKIFRNKKGTCYHDSCVTGIRPYQCTHCSRSFVKRSHFEYHERTHSGYRPFKCTLCDKAFPQKNKLNRHMFSHSKLKPFPCTKCGKSYCKKDDLKTHMSIHSGLTPFSCKTCGKAFRILTNLKRHIRTHSSERPHACEQCNKSFKDKSLLKRHKRIHGKERPFSCALCTRLFLSKCELRRHLTTHSNEKPFSCEFCKTEFRRKDNLNRHIRHHHSEDSNIVCEKTPSKPSNDESKSSKTKKAPSKRMPKKNPKSSSSLVSKNSSKGSMVLANSQNQINSRLDPMGNITPVIRTTGELSNAVPVINGPISIKKFVETTESRKKTFTYIEPIPLAEAVVINKRIEEKLYPQNSSNNYFFRNYSTPSRAGISNNCGNYKNDSEKLPNQPERNRVKLKIKEITGGNESDVRNLSTRLDRGNFHLEQRSNFSQVSNKNSVEMRNHPSKNLISLSESGSDSKLANEQPNYVSTIKKHVPHPGNQIEPNTCDKNSEVEDLQKTSSTYWRRRTAETLKPNCK